VTPAIAAPPAAGGLAALRQLSAAEEFFEFFALPFEPRVVQVYRLHILRHFAQELERIDRTSPGLAEPERLALYREALRRAHDVFVHSTAQEQRLFKVFQADALVTLGRRAP
jgi:nitrogenase-stabilizing/protective protein